MQRCKLFEEVFDQLVYLPDPIMVNTSSHLTMFLELCLAKERLPPANVRKCREHGPHFLQVLKQQEDLFSTLNA